jgi:hypothetical protein
MACIWSSKRGKTGAPPLKSFLKLGRVKERFVQYRVRHSNKAGEAAELTA